MFKKFKEFAKGKSVFATPKNGTAVLYCYVGNTIAYLETNIVLDSSIVFSTIDKCNTIEEIFAMESKKDEEPFDFDLNIKIHTEKVTSTKLVQVFSSFNKFYNTEANRTELTGIHIKSGNIFATDSHMVKLAKLDLVGKDANMVIDINPILDYLDINSKKITNTGKSLFKSSAVKNDEIVIGYIDNKTDSGLYLEIEGLNFLIISICESNLDFSYIKSFKEKNKLTVHTQTLLKEVSKLLDNPEQDTLDICKDIIKFDMSDKTNKILLSLYEYNGRASINTSISAKVLSDSVFSINGRKLIEIIKEIKDSTLDISLNEDTKVPLIRFNSKTNNTLLVLAGTNLK